MKTTFGVLRENGPSTKDSAPHMLLNGNGHGLHGWEILHAFLSTMFFHYVYPWGSSPGSHTCKYTLARPQLTLSAERPASISNFTLAIHNLFWMHLFKFIQCVTPQLYAHVHFLHVPCTQVSEHMPIGKASQGTSKGTQGSQEHNGHLWRRPFHLQSMFFKWLATCCHILPEFYPGHEFTRMPSGTVLGVLGCGWHQWSSNGLALHPQS